MPPDPQPFLRIPEVSGRVFLSNLDRLRLALEATRDINPEAVQIFYEARKVLSEELQTAFGALHMGKLLTERYWLLLEALSKRIPTQHLLDDVNLGAYSGMRYSKKGQKAMCIFRRELERAVVQVTTSK
jgi:hypothetical protein